MKNRTICSKCKSTKDTETRKKKKEKQKEMLKLIDQMEKIESQLTQDVVTPSLPPLFDGEILGLEDPPISTTSSFEVVGETVTNNIDYNLDDASSSIPSIDAEVQPLDNNLNDVESMHYLNIEMELNLPDNIDSNIDDTSSSIPSIDAEVQPMYDLNQESQMEQDEPQPISVTSEVKSVNETRIEAFNVETPMDQDISQLIPTTSELEFVNQTGRMKRKRPYRTRSSTRKERQEQASKIADLHNLINKLTNDNLFLLNELRERTNLVNSQSTEDSIKSNLIDTLKLENRILKMRLTRLQQKLAIIQRRRRRVVHVIKLQMISVAKLAPLFDEGVTRRVYENIRNVIHSEIKKMDRKYKKLLPCYSSISDYRKKIANENMPHWEPRSTTDGIEFHAEAVLKQIAREHKWEHGSTHVVCVGDDGRAISKGIKGVAPQTIVGIAERKPDQNMSPDFCYRIGLFWGSEQRHLLKRNLTNFIQTLEKKIKRTWKN
jgi:hypothetical protein